MCGDLLYIRATPLFLFRWLKITLNKLDDRFSASAALVGDAIFLRGEKFLYCIDGKD